MLFLLCLALPAGAAGWRAARATPRRAHATLGRGVEYCTPRRGGVACFADLLGGADAERNAAIEALKASFYGATPKAAASDCRRVATARIGGLLRDLPVCRWSMVMLPHTQTVLNVWQPQYTHLFEELVRGPEPWLYAHIQLPGGVESLNDPKYDFNDDSSPAPRLGTLCRVAAGARFLDARRGSAAGGRVRKAAG